MDTIPAQLKLTKLVPLITGCKAVQVKLAQV